MCTTLEPYTVLNVKVPKGVSSFHQDWLAPAFNVGPIALSSDAVDDDPTSMDTSTLEDSDATLISEASGESEFEGCYDSLEKLLHAY